MFLEERNGQRMRDRQTDGQRQRHREKVSQRWGVVEPERVLEGGKLGGKFQKRGGLRKGKVV